MSKKRDKVAAANCRAILKRHTVDGRVDHKAFLSEMDERALYTGIELTSDQYALLGQIAAAYEKELAS